MFFDDYFNLLIQTLIPITLGLSVLFISRKVITDSCCSSFIFLIAQLFLISISKYTSQESLIYFFILLATIALTIGTSKYFKISKIFFVLFILSWTIEKVVPLLNRPAELHQTYLNSIIEITKQLSIIGVSYIGFKLIHFYVDQRSGKIKDYKPLDFLSWLFFFPTLIAGPMQRYQDWQSQRALANFNIASVVLGVQRIIYGLFYKLVIADLLYLKTLPSMSDGTLAVAPFSEIFVASMFYTVYLFFDFAGYSSIAIGLALFWDIRLPENFNKPYLARNLAEFWNRWHITLSEILRDYLYYPVSLSLKRKSFFKKHPLIGIVLPPIITFVIAGLWHGLTVGFFIFGLLHGVGLAFIAILGRYRNNKIISWAHNSKVQRYISALITFFYVSFAFIFFCLNNERLQILFQLN